MHLNRRSLFMFTLSTHRIVPSFALCSSCDVSSTNDEITEFLAIQPLEGIALDHWLEDGKDFWLCDGFCIDRAYVRKC